MNKKICNIILDLLPEYIEDDVTDDTREFIEEHIKNCSNCKDILENMKTDIIEEQDKLKNDMKIEVEKIKKVNRNLKVHKIILVISSIIVLVITAILLGKEIYNRFNKTLYYKIQEVYEENIRLDNYYITKTINVKSYDSSGEFNYISDTYVKNGEYKGYTYWTTNTDKGVTKDTPQYICYGKIGENEPCIKINMVNQVIYNSESTYVLQGEYYNKYLKAFENIDDRDIEIRTFAEKEWYVYRVGNDTEYCEYWIDTNNLTDIRIIESNAINYTENLIVLEKDIVTDEDMKIDYDISNFKHIELGD